MSDLVALAASLRTVLPPGIGLGVADPRAAPAPLYPQEAASTRRMVDKRHREFAAGREAARAAMADLGLPPTAIPMGADRAPLWPAGLCGSISHSAGAAVALVARRGRAGTIGIDIEDDSPLAPDLWPEILTASELDNLMRAPGATRGHRAKRIFSAKEAVYKAQYPLTERMLGFGDVALSLTRTGFTARVDAPDSTPEWSGLFVRAGGLISSIVCPA